MNIKELLQLTIEHKASDLHLVAGVAPYLRIEGELLAVDGAGILTPELITALVTETLNAEQMQRLVANKEIDLGLSFSDQARFRVNVYTQKGSWAAAFRRIPVTIPSIDGMGMPKILHKFSTLRQGLVLVTGPTGQGKSTTLAAILNEINANRSAHILTIEDPIEFVFRPIKSVITQREMGADTHSWTMALRSALREDPDVVLVGEMRDYETIAAALTVAETGHLVFATLHTNSAAQTIDRIVDVFPENQQVQVRMQLSNVIEAVFSQRLVPSITNKRVAAHEVLLGSTAIRTAIRDGKTHQIDSIIQTSTEMGMRTLEMSLAEYVKNGTLTLDVAQSFSLRPDELNRLVQKQ